MADVSVEFGAKDVGLEKTLKTIQDQMVSLQGEVNSGTLSFQEISQKMREIKTAEGIFSKLGGEVSEAAKSFKELEDQTRRAEAITKSNRTAIEVYSDTVDELQKLLDAGAISQKTYASAIDKAEAALKAATPQTEEAKRANEELEASLKKAEQETKALAEEQKKAEAITKANRSATEIYNQEVEELQKHLSEGRISMETFEKAVGKADAKLAAASPQVEEIGKDIQDAGNKSEKMGEQSGMGFGKLVAAVGLGQIAAKAFTAVLDSAFAAVRGTIQGFTDALDLGGRLSDLSASTGETAGKLLILERAFDNSGIGADKVGSSIAKMQKNIEDARDGSGTAANAFAMMGVKVEELEGKLPTEQLKILSSGIQSIDDPTQRAAAAMGVFGKSGAELLPLLTNLEGELGEARDTVGSMAEIMDRRNATFDAVSDRFKTIGEKVRDFAAGILDKALPAIDAITTALSRIDAAKIGQNLADAFLGGQEAMSGFQASVDAIKTGNISAAFSIFWDSLQLQAAQTANEIYKRLIAAFQTAGQLLGEIFSPTGALIGTVVSSFELLGQKAKTAILENLAGAFDGNMLTQGIADNLKAMAGESKTAATSIEESLKGAGGRIADQFIEAGKALPESFQENYAKVPPLFNDLSKLQKSIENQEKAIKKTTESANAEREKTNETLEAEKSVRAAIAKQALVDADKEKANAVKLIEFETAINEAKAAGNEELVKSLESEKKRLEDQKEIAKLTAEYTPLVGGNADEAKRLATNMVNAKNAAAAIGDRKAVVTVAVNTKELDDLITKLRVADNPHLVDVICRVTGAKSMAEAEQTLQNIQAAEGKKDVIFSATKAKSWDEVFDKLSGLPPVSSRKLAMSLTKTKNFDEALDQIWKVPESKDVKMQLKAAGFESLKSFKASLTEIPSQKDTKVICEALNVEDLEGAKKLITNLLAFNGATTEIKAAADTTPAENALNDTARARSTTVSASADTSKAQQAIENLGSKAIKGNLDASESIKTIRKDLEKEVDLGLNSSDGTKILGNIESLLDDLKTIVDTLSQKLPTPALV